MFCPECGTEMPDDARFCGECGTSVAPAAGGATPPAGNGAPPPKVQTAAHVVDLEAKAEAVPDALKYGIIAASVLIPLIGIIMGVIYLANGDSEEKKSVGKLWLISGLVIGVIWIGLSGGGY